MLDGLFKWLGFNKEKPKEVVLENPVKVAEDVDLQALEVSKWLTSPRRLLQVRAFEEYNYNFSTNDRRLMRRDADGMPIALGEQSPDVLDNLYANMVDQKVNYILGKPFTLQANDEKYVEELGKVLDKDFRRVLYRTATNAVIGGIGWIYPYYDEQGALKFKQYAAHEVLPFWNDADHTVLDLAIRHYTTTEYVGNVEKPVDNIEVFTPNGIQCYVLENGKLTPKEARAYAYRKGEQENEPVTWAKIPLVAFKYNAQEIPLLKRIDSIQNAINDIRSSWAKSMNEGINDTILVLQNYDGQNLTEFRQNLIKHGAVKVSDGGGVNTLRIERPGDAYIDYLDHMKKALITNARGFDAKDDRTANNPNEMNLRSMYSDIDLDADMIEVEFQAAFDNLLWFVDAHLINTGRGDYTGEEVTLTFNRNMIVNDADVIENIKNSAGIVSNETLLAHHPFVANVQQEQERIEAEKPQTEYDYSRAINGKTDGKVLGGAV